MIDRVVAWVRELLTIEDPLFRKIAIVAGVALVCLALLTWTLSRAWDVDRYRGQRVRPAKLEPWMLEHTGERPALQPDAEPPLAADHTRVLRMPLRPRLGPATPSIPAMPRQAYPGAHRAHGDERERTRTLHPGDYRALGRVPRVEHVPEEDAPWPS